MRKYIRYVGLSMVSTLGYSLYVLADTFFIANGIGSDGLTSLNLALPLYNLIFGIGLLLAVGGATKYTILQVQKETKAANQYYNHVIRLGIILSIPFIIMGALYAKEIVILLGAKGKIISMTVPYLRTYLMFTPFFIFQYIFTTFIKNDHNPKLVSIATISGTLFNIVFDYIFIFPCHLGMFGAALATGFSPVVSMMICLFHYPKATFHLEKIKWKISYLQEIFTIGMPALINEFSTGLIILVFNYVILGITGNIGVASYGIISNLAIIVSALYNGITQGNQPLLSESFGKNDLKQVSQYLKYAIITSLIFSTVVFLTTLVFPDFIISLFNSESNTALEMIAKVGLPLYFVGYFFSGINMVMISYFASIERPKPSFIISICHGGLLIIPIVIVLSLLLEMKGVWLSYPVSEIITLWITYKLFKHKTYQMN